MIASSPGPCAVKLTQFAAQFDMLGFGAWRLSKLTPAGGLWSIMLGIMIVAAIALVMLAWWWRRAGRSS